jgi:hypothetical protein
MIEPMVLEARTRRSSLVLSESEALGDSAALVESEFDEPETDPARDVACFIGVTFWVEVG